MDKKLLRVLRGEINEALKAVAAKHGLTIEAGNCSYEVGRAKFQLHVVEGDGGATAKAEWDLHCTRFGLLPEDFGKYFEIRGRCFQICGVAPKSPVRPILADGDDLKKYKFQPVTVADALRRL